MSSLNLKTRFEEKQARSRNNDNETLEFHMVMCRVFLAIEFSSKPYTNFFTIIYKSGFNIEKQKPIAATNSVKIDAYKQHKKAAEFSVSMTGLCK